MTHPISVPASASDGDFLERTAPLSLTILGATGSIGKSTVDLVLREPARYRIEAVVAGSDAAALADIARKTGARHAAVANEAALPALKEALAGTAITAAGGRSAVIEAAGRPVDMVLSAIVGAAGLAPSLAALGSAKAVALANKETLVLAGSLFMREAAARGTRILPVDSEHNAIFQVLEARNTAAVTEIILTASGGPFRTLTIEELKAVTPERALKHPNWVMGRKVTIDSSTLMNKGLELIEARHLFNVPAEKLGVLVHPQSAVHGLVRYADGSLLAELGAADMRTAIGYCLDWPRRRPTPVAALDLARLGRLDFEAPDRTRFPCLALAEDALRRGGGAPAVLNAANEVAVDAFLDRQIAYLDIAAVVSDSLETAEAQGLLIEPGDLAAAEAIDGEGRRLAAESLARRAS